jgi:PAS domain S-box-containing protein
MALQRLAGDIIATIREPMLVLDEDLRVVLANRSFYKTFKVKPEETEGQRLIDLGNRQWNVPQLRKLLKEILPKKTTVEHFEVTHDFPEIGPKTILLNARQVRDRGSRFILLAMEDVTGQKRSDKAVSESERKYKFLYEESLAFNVAVGIDETVLDINRAALERLGYRKKEVLGKPIWDFVLKEEKEKVKKLLHWAMKGKLSEQEEISLRAKDGSVHTILFAPKELRLEEAGAVTGMVFTGMNITDRKRWEEKLAFHSQALSQISDAVVAVDNDYRIVFWNPGSERMYGFKRKEVMGRLLEAVYQYRWPKPEDEKAAYAALESKGFWRGENIHTTKDGVEIFVESTVTVLKNDQGNKVGLLAVTRDITERKTAEEELAKAHNLLETLLTQAPIGFAYFDRDLRFLRINQRLAETNGLPVAAHLGKTIGEVVPELLPIAKKVVNQILTTGQPVENHEFSGEITSMPGETHYWNESWYPVHDIHGEIIGFGAVVEDITERKRTEEELKRLSQGLEREYELVKTIMEHSTAQMAYLDPNFDFVRVNSAYAKGTGHKMSDLIGKNHFELFPDEENQRIFEKVRDTGRPVSFKSKPFVFADQPERGTTYWDWTLTPVKDNQGNLRGLVLSVVDVTDREKTLQHIEQLNQDLSRRTKELANVNQELEAFTYSVSHDLRAPLRSVSGFSRALLEDYQDKLDEQGKDYLRRVRGASSRMQQLIDDLLKLSRISRSEIKQTEVNLTQLAQNVANRLRRASPARKIDFIIQGNVKATGDRNLLRVVLENLLRNAWKFTRKRAKAKIEFGAKEINGQTTYFVRDNGAGFDPGYTDKLFVPFQRLHSSSEFPGSGIGLATVKRIINRHGGRVWAEGKSEKGATFYFTL